MILGTIGLALLGISGSVLAAPVALPAAVVTAAGYIAVTGGVMSAVSQVTVEDFAKKEADEEGQSQGGEPDG